MKYKHGAYEDGKLKPGWVELETMALPREVEEEYSAMAQSCNWYAHHFYRYLMELGFEAFLKDKKQEHEGFIDYEDDAE